MKLALFTPKIFKTKKHQFYMYFEMTPYYGIHIVYNLNSNSFELFILAFP